SLGEGAGATLLETHAGSGGEACFANLLTGVLLGEGARLDHLRLQYESEAAFHFSSTGARLQRDSRYLNHNLCLGARLNRNDIAVELAGEGAAVELHGLTLGGGRSHLDNHTRVDHLAPHTTSAENYKAVLGDRARGVFNGKVVVHPGAQKIVAGQSSRNLLLSAGAEMDTKPELEIYADDVQCHHGATVGQLDELALFYLRSRGVPEAEARAMLIHAFAGEVLRAIDHEGLRRHCHALVDRRVDQLLGQDPEEAS
ncbi:MAG: Fe-S cluster assembly protein SufD, partial [Gammaproteobacteria bacterium]